MRVLAACAAGLLLMSSEAGQAQSGSDPVPIRDKTYLSLSPEQQRSLSLLDSLWTHAARESSLALNDALLESPAAQESALRAQLLLRRGAHRLFYGQAVVAEPDLREVVAFTTATKDTLMGCRAMRWLGMSMELQGRRQEACEILERGLAWSTACGDSTTACWTLVGLAYQANAFGRFHEALEQYERAAQLFGALGDLEGESWAHNGRGMALTSQGAYLPALAAFRQSQELARRRGHPMSEAMALNNIGTLEYSQGDPGAGLHAFEEALRLHRDLGNVRETVAPLINTALCYGKLGRRDQAESALQEALQICQNQTYRDLEAVTLGHLARLSREYGRHREAAQRYEQALALADHMPLQAQVTSILGLSDVMGDLEDYQRALEYLDQAEKLMAGMSSRAAWPQVEMQRGVLLTRAGRPREGLAALAAGTRSAGKQGLDNLHALGLVEQARAHRVLGQPDSALAALERAARVWEDMRAAPLDPVWREQRGSLSREIGTDLAVALLEVPGLAEGDRIRSAFDRLQLFKARTLQERMQGPMAVAEDERESLAAHESGTPAIPSEQSSTLALVTLDELQRDVLQPGELFLDTYVGSRVSLLFAVTRDDCRVRRLPPADELGGVLRRYHELLAVPAVPVESAALPVSAAALGSTTERLSELLFGELTGEIAGCRRAIVSPDGPLNLVPLSLLLHVDSDEATQMGAGSASGPEWVRVPSATILMWLREQAPAASGEGPLSVCAVADTSGEGGTALRGVSEELAALQGRVRDVEVHAPWVTGPPLTIEELCRAGMIHVAAHFRANDQNPWQSRLPILPDRADGGLRAGEIAGLSLSARLVVLSSCESAGGKIVSGEGVLGLCQALLSAGTRAVVATLWPVDDRVTARFMEHFYAGLVQGAPVATALQGAQEAIRAQPETRHPFYWAAFVVIGDADVQVPLGRPILLKRLQAPAILVAAGAAGVFLAIWWSVSARQRARRR